MKYIRNAKIKIRLGYTCIFDKKIYYIWMVKRNYLSLQPQ